MGCRLVQLLTDPRLVTYYVFALIYIVGYASVSKEQPRVFMYSALRVLPLMYLMGYIIYSHHVLCNYTKYIMVGLLMSAFAEALHIYDWGFFIHVVAIYSLVMMVYTGGMYCKYRGNRLSWLIVPVDLMVMIVLYFQVAGYLSPIVLFCFGFFTVAMAFFALARFEKERTAPAYLGAAGGILFQIHCFFYALGMFSPRFVCIVSQELVMLTYYLGQLGIGLSVHFC